MNRHVNIISNRLSLRKPQRDSLEILAEIADLLPMKKEADSSAALEAVNKLYPSVTAFDGRTFPSLCFALATGVGKTRLMGAFIAYLHLAKGIRHFFVLAPNLTIYNKLIVDFQDRTHPKYVFQGIAEFAVEPPEIITGDNYETGRGVRKYDLFGETCVHINVFNISKINSEVRGGKAPRFKRLQEYIGQSYFEYLSGLDDLVLLQDESHRYRASAGVNAINELQPILGLELTATPQVEQSGGAKPFGNVIYSYPLSRAMHDGFVKEPVVATRENFNPENYKEEGELEDLKLMDGIQVHERAKVDLEIFARERDLKIVKPFMLVVAQDTAHANRLEERIKRDDFFEGRYKDRVITVHSNQSGEEKDEVVQRLLAVEDPKEPTEIVIHVNMLKEGWDVTNLYTIVPLRAAKSETLVEQSIGRGLRLPYGRRTGVKSIDRLTIVAHDRFQEILDDARNPNSRIHGLIRGGITIEPNAERQEVVVVRPLCDVVASSKDDGNLSTQEKIPFPTAAEQVVAQATVDVIRRVALGVHLKDSGLRSASDLQKPEVMEQIIEQVQKLVAPGQQTIEGMGNEAQVAATVQKAVELWVSKSMDIPRVTILPKEGADFGYNDFDLDIAAHNFPPVSQEILLAYIRSEERERLNADTASHREKRLEDYIVRRLVQEDDISYDHQSDLLYKLAGQMVAHVRSLHSEEQTVLDVIRFHERKMADLIHVQMQDHLWTKETGFEVTVRQGVTTLRETNHSRPLGEDPIDFRAPVEEKQFIRSLSFGGFRKCLYPSQKFDSDPERRFAMILEAEPMVEKWLRPAKGQFQIFYRLNHNDQSYEPDFAVETKTQMLLCEPKRVSEMTDEIVTAKAKAAVEWCRHASEHAKTYGGKPWTYLLIPNDAITASATLDALVSVHRLN